MTLLDLLNDAAGDMDKTGKASRRFERHVRQYVQEHGVERLTNVHVISFRHSGISLLMAAAYTGRRHLYEMLLEHKPNEEEAVWMDSHPREVLDRFEPDTLRRDRLRNEAANSATSCSSSQSSTSANNHGGQLESVRRRHDDRYRSHDRKRAWNVERETGDI